MFVLALPVLTQLEPPPPPDAARASVWRFLAQAKAARVLSTLFFVNFSRALFVAMFGAFLTDKGLSLGQIGLIAGATNSIMAVLAMLFGANLVRRFGVKKSASVMIPISLLAVPAVLWLVLAPSPSLVAVVLVVAWLTLVTTPITLCVLVARLGWTSRGQVGTDFTVQASAYFGGFLLATAVAGPLAEWLGWLGFFMLQAGLMLCSIIYFVVQHDRIEGDMAAWRERASAS
jgi:MFS transporter, putative signal transducer